MMASILSEFAIRHRPPQHPLDPLKPHGQVVKPSPNAAEGAPHFLKTSPKLPFKRAGSNSATPTNEIKGLGANQI